MSYVFLVAPMLLILIFWIYFVKKSVSYSTSSFKAWFKLEAKKGLLEQPLLWFVISLPIIEFLSLGAIAWDGYRPELSADGFNKFLEISKLPLGVLALALPLSALVIRLHGTHQTALQIAATDYKNKQDSYYAHEMALHSYFTRISPQSLRGLSNKLSFDVDNRLYRKMFPQNSPSKGVYPASSIFLNQLSKEIVELGDIIFYLNQFAAGTRNLDLCASLIFDGTKKLNSICYRLFLAIPQEEKKGKWLKTRVGSVAYKFSTTDELVGQFRFLYFYVNQLHSFAHQDYKYDNTRIRHLLEDPMYEAIAAPEIVSQVFQVDRTFEYVKYEFPD